ncbi:MAG: inositol oxygenase, partial [Candidatus Hydrogenedentes bacterium]|nr:inositol oxygenase [Candidatus Hydrogenedentota bacterium]
SIEEWEDDVHARYPEPEKPFAPHKDKSEFRDYEHTTRPTVREFYRINHKLQTYDFVRQKQREFGALNKKKMGIWEAIEYLNTLVDDSDPDTDLSQIQHLLQTSEAIRADGHPRWFVLTGLVHDLGKILCLYGEPQWAVVGDTFPVGCKFSEKIVFPQFFADNPDASHAVYGTANGAYEAGCGLDRIAMSWGHDEYMYYVAKDYLPEPALYMIRYHSFYAAHREGEYQHLMTDHDKDMFKWVRAFNPYDLYSKSPVPPDVAALRPYYEDLIAEFFPAQVAW